jgi:hypothetical protein
VELRLPRNWVRSREVDASEKEIKPFVFVVIEFYSAGSCIRLAVPRGEASAVKALLESDLDCRDEKAFLATPRTRLRAARWWSTAARELP